MPQTLRFYEADGHRIAVRVINEKRNGRPMVVFHGLFMSLNIWPELLPTALRDRPIYSFGLPAHFPSRPPSQFMRRPMPESLFTQGLPGVIRGMLGRRHFDLLGHCAGGYAALGIAAKMSSQINRMAIISGFSHGELLGAVGRLQRYSRLPAAGVAFGAMRLAFLANTELVRWASASTGGEPRAVRRWTRESAAFGETLIDWRRSGAGPIRHFLLQLRQHDASDLLKDIRCPVRLIQGERDPVVPVGQARLLARRIPESDLKTISAAGHLPFAETPKELEHLLTDWYDN